MFIVLTLDLNKRLLIILYTEFKIQITQSRLSINYSDYNKSSIHTHFLRLSHSHLIKYLKYKHKHMKINSHSRTLIQVENDL